MQININLNVRGLNPSATLLINERSNELIKRGKKVYKFGLGQSPFPVPDHVVEALKKNAFQKDYLPVKGLPELREAIATFHQRLNGFDFQADNVIIGPGSKELIFILQLVYYGDLIIPTPSWVSYSPQAQIVGRKVLWIKTNEEEGYKLTADKLASICKDDPEKPRVVILNYPSNPTGCSYTAAELQSIAKVARKHKIVLISDEIYGLIHHEGHHESIARYYPEGTIISSGLSKWCGAGGWRLGYFIIPDKMSWINNAMSVVASETFTATSAPIQYAAISAFEPNAAMDDYLRRSRLILKNLAAELVKILGDSKLRFPAPQGGFYLFLNAEAYRKDLQKRGIENSADLCHRLLEETGVAILPGSDFGCDPSLLMARLAYVNFDGTLVMEKAKAEKVNAAFIKKYCPETLEGVRKMVEWMKGGE